jgi:hypothetical protein
MTSAQDYLFKYSKWLIFVLAYLFLGYKLVTFDGYEALLEHFSSVSFHDYLFLFFVFLLLPFNLFFEALKWQRLVAGLQPISLGFSCLSLSTPVPLNCIISEAGRSEPSFAIGKTEMLPPL